MEMETDLFDRIRPNEVLIASFPYKCVPTVAALMVNHTFTRLNHVLSAEDKPTVGYLNVFKYPWQASGEHYFAHMGEQARRRILDNVELIVVVDIRLTGATEDKFLQLLYRVEGLASLTVVYLCDVEPAVA